LSFFLCAPRHHYAAGAYIEPDRPVLSFHCRSLIDLLSVGDIVDCI